MTKSGRIETGMMEPTDPSNGSQDTATEIMVGLDVVGILTSRFAREMGRQFDRHWQESLDGTRETTRRLFAGIQPGEENRTINTHIVQARLEDGGEEPEGSPAVRGAFIDVIESLLDSVRRGPRAPPGAGGLRRGDPCAHHGGEVRRERGRGKCLHLDSHRGRGSG